MDRILPAILVVAATLLSCDGSGGGGHGIDAAVDRRYGGRSIFGQQQHQQRPQRPSYFFGQYAVGHGRPAFGPAPGGHAGPFGHAAGVLPYRPSSAPLVLTHGSGHGSGTYHATLVGHGQAGQRPAGGGQQPLAQASNQHASYVRPFGMPEGQRFPFGGFTYRLPDRRPPNPPVRSSYKSKPYPDFIVRFKSPTYPSQVATSVFEKPPPLPPAPVPSPTIGAPLAGPAGALPLYEPGESPGADTLSVVGDSGSGQGVSGSGINVGASYQTGGNIPVFVSQVPAVQSIVHPPSTSIYLMSDAAADKQHTDPAAEAPRTPQLTSNVFVDVSKDSPFGVTNEPGIIRPLKQDVVYSPDETGTFKPMYIFGPVFFPKEEQDAADSASSSSVQDAQKCTSEGDPKCDSKSAGSDVAAAIVVNNNETTTTTTTSTTASPDDVSSTTVKPKKSGKKSVSAVRDVVDADADDDADDADAELDGGGGSRGLIGVIRGILGVGDRDRDGIDDDDADLDEEERLSRGDKNKKKNKSKGSTRLTPIEDDYEDDSPSPPRPSSSSKRRRKPSNTRNSAGGNNSRRGSNSQSRFVPSHKKFQNGGRDDGGHLGLDSDSEGAASDHLQTGEKKQDNNVNSNMQNMNPGFEPPNDAEFESDNVPQPNDRNQQGDGNDNAVVSGGGGGGQNDDRDPVVGPVQVGFIGRPPPGSPYNPNQPFFYAAGIPAFERNPLSSSPDFPQLTAHRKFSVGGGGGYNEGNIRRYFDDADAGGVGNYLSGDRRLEGASGNDDMDTGIPQQVKPTSYYEGFPQQGYRDYAPGIPITNDNYNTEQLDQEPADSSSSEVTDKSIGKSSTTAAAAATDANEGKSMSSTSSVVVSAAADVTSSVASTESLPLSLPYVAARPESSSDAAAILNDDVIVEHVTTPSPSPSFYDDGGNDYRVSTSKAYLDENTTNVSSSSSMGTSTSTVTSSSPSFYDKLSYSAVTRRRPFPSFYKYRTSYRPKSANYIVPTTYRPATATLTATSSSRTTKATSSTVGFGSDGEESRDSSATVANSVHDYDDYRQQPSSSTTMSASTSSVSTEESGNAIVAPPFHGLEPVVSDDGLIRVHEFSTEFSPFGSRITAPSLKHKMKPVVKS